MLPRDPPDLTPQRTVGGRPDRDGEVGAREQRGRQVRGRVRDADHPAATRQGVRTLARLVEVAEAALLAGAHDGLVPTRPASELGLDRIDPGEGRHDGHHRKRASAHQAVERLPRQRLVEAELGDAPARVERGRRVVVRVVPALVVGRAVEQVVEGLLVVGHGCLRREAAGRA